MYAGRARHAYFLRSAFAELGQLSSLPTKEKNNIYVKTANRLYILIRHISILNLQTGNKKYFLFK